MFGKTNTIYKEDTDLNELTLHFEVILTDLSQNIKKIKYLNNTYFVFCDSGEVMYGNSLTELKYLKDGETYIKSNYVIYCDGQYVFASNKKIYSTANQNGTAAEPAHAYLYKTNDLISFQTITIDLGDVTIKNCMNINGLFINSKGKIVALLSERPDKLWFGIFDNIEDIKTKSDFTLIQEINYNKFDSDTGLSSQATLYKDYIFITTSDQYYTIISPEGMHSSYSRSNKPSFLYGDIYLKSMSDNNDLNIYYSYNGSNWQKLGKLCDYRNISLYALYDNNALGIFVSNGISYEFVYAETWQSIIGSYDNKIEVEKIGINGNLNCAINVGPYTYLGSNGGVIYKTWVDYSSNNLAPDVSVLKTLSAKQALMEAKIYTDHKWMELENRIALLELEKDIDSTES